MRQLDLDQLKTFVTVCDAGSLTAAASRLYLAPSSVSEQLSNLEQRVGLTLLERGRRGATPTSAGLRLLDHARGILALSERALRDVAGHPLEGELTLAVSDYYRPAEIARLLARLREQYPKLHLRVLVAQSAQIESAQGGAAFDIGLSMRIVGSAAAARRGDAVLRREALHWVCAPQSLVALERPLPLVALPQGCSLQVFATHTLKRHRLPYVLAHSASGVAGLQLVIAAGLGVACLNTSSIGAGIARCAANCGLPALPQVEFVLLAGPRGQSGLVADVRAVLRALFD